MSELDRRTREYLLELITTLKNTRKRITDAEEERSRWAKRESLARDKGREELAGEAARRRAEAEQKLERLRREERELAAEAEGAREEWNRAGIREEMNVDAERLLASLEQIAGKPDPAANELKELELDEELSRLKAGLQGETAPEHEQAEPEEAPQEDSRHDSRTEREEGTS
jgi:hypothetical protein